MHAAVLLCDTSARPTPTVGSAVRHHVFVNGFRLQRAVYLSADRTLSGSGKFEVGCPLYIRIGGQWVPNPGLSTAASGLREIWVRRDGDQVIARGYIDKPASIDLTLNWVRLACVDSVEDINQTAVGTGLNTWKNDPDQPPDTPPEVDPLVTGWQPANAAIGSITSPWGAGITVTYGTEKTNPWHFAYISMTLTAKQRFRMSGRLNLAPKQPKKKIITISKRFLDKPKKAFKTTVSIPVDTPEGRWSDEINLPTLEGSDTALALYDFAVWSPVKTGSHAAVIRGKLIVEDKDSEDPEVPVVKVGGTTSDFVTRLMQGASARAGAFWTVTNRGGGIVFDDGMAIDPADTGTFGSHISTYSASSEYRWRPHVNDTEVGGPGVLGSTWVEIRASNRPGARVRATVVAGSSKGKARYVTVTGSDDDRTFALTFDSGVGRGHDLVVSAPSDTNFFAWAAAENAKANTPGLPTTVELPTPPGGRSPGDWLTLGLNVGDRIMVTVDAGPWSQELVAQRITGLHHDGRTDFVTLQVEPVP